MDADAPDGVVSLLCEDPRWEVLDLGGLAERAAVAALRADGFDPDTWVIDVLAGSDARIATLNATYRGKNTPTNVLSWPSVQDDDAWELPGDDWERRTLGSLALAFETCLREAEAGGLSLADHVTHLVVHGVFHLLGYDHEEDAAAEEMEALEGKVLASLGVVNPYRV
jgi:probable rRNA maturation factor